MLNPRSSRRGQSMVEAMMAMVVMGTAIWGSISVYRMMGNSERMAGDRTEIVLSAARIRALAAFLVMGQWKMLSRSGCQTSVVGARFVASVGAAGDLQLMDRARIDLAVTGPLRDQINEINGKGADAFKACSDPAVLGLPNFHLLANSAYNQALCRCAVAATTYETLRAPLADVSGFRNVYGCVQTATVGPESKMVYEVSAHVTDMVSGDRASCSQISSLDWTGVLSRVDYTTSAEGSAQSRISGTYYLPVGAMD